MTISKNTKKAKEILAAAKNIRSFSLESGFSGQPMSNQDYLARELNSMHSKLTTDGNGKYMIKVHGNLWYEFEAA